MAADDRLSLLDGISSCDVIVDIDVRTHSALATFTVDGDIRWSMSLWLDGRCIEGFVLSGAVPGWELVVRDLAVAAAEPAVAAAVAAVCGAGDLTVADIRTP
jgi:hypothetical protein